MNQKIKAVVPGSIMLMGEHAVLFGELALACAVDKYIEVELIPRTDNQVIVRSALADYRGQLSSLPEEPRLSFVVQALQNYAGLLPAGFELSISSQFSHKVGLGSSAAVTAGTVAVLSRYAGQHIDPMGLFDQSLQVVHQVQDGRGSGTDLVASIFGGIVAYRVNPREIRSLQASPEIQLYYAGYKTPTPEVLKLVESKAALEPDLYARLYRMMGEISESAEQVVAENDWAQLGRLMNIYQGLMDALGVSDLKISEMVYGLRQQEGNLGSKISGSGLGDCVIALGKKPAETLPFEEIPVAVSIQGLSFDGH